MDSLSLRELFKQKYRPSDACTEEFGYTDGRPNFMLKVEEATNKVNRFISLSKELYVNNFTGNAFEAYFNGLHTGKGDTSVEQVQKYCARDGFKYLVMWVGRPELFDNVELWHCCSKFIAYCVSLDDICVPGDDVPNGRYKFLGDSLEDLLRWMKELDKNNELDPRWLKLAVDDVFSGAQLQFYEKLSICAELNPNSSVAWPSKANFINLFRNEPDLLQGYLMRSFDGFSLACACVISYLQKLTFSKSSLELYYAAALGDMMGMDIGKDMVRIGHKCPTNFIERLEVGTVDNLARFKKSCELFYAINSKLVREPALRRYSEVSLFFGTSHDRYLERQLMTRLPIKGCEDFEFLYTPIPL